MDDYLAKLRYRLSEQHFKWFSISPSVVDEQYGSFTAAWRFTRDQVPLPFDLTGGKAWFHDLHTSQVVSCGAGLDKRQATLDLMFSGDLSEDQPAPAIIFRGTGQRVSHFERANWDEDVVVLFQKNAWQDGPTQMDWAERVMVPHMRRRRATWSTHHGVPIEEAPYGLMIQDNLASQCRQELDLFTCDVDKKSCH